MKVVITPRERDYHACIEDRPEIWRCGRTPDAALGNLATNHQERFNLTIARVPSPGPKQ